jgi:hypothetical protein
MAAARRAGEDSRGFNERDAVMKAVIGVGIAVLLLALAACDRKNVFSLEVGTCFDDTDALYGGQEITTVPVRKCDEPHDNEVFALLQLEGDEFPGQAQVEQMARERCHDAFEGYVGRDYASSRFEFAHMVPSPDTWRLHNDREIVCFLYDMELAKLDASARGSGE